jgi:hypothetical protein
MVAAANMVEVAALVGRNLRRVHGGVDDGIVLASSWHVVRRGRSAMSGIPSRHSHFVFAVIQAGLTCLIASGIASLPVVTISQFLTHWLLSWVVSWITMLPVVLLAAPIIRSVSLRLTNGQ